MLEDVSVVEQLLRVEEEELVLEGLLLVAEVVQPACHQHVRRLQIIQLLIRNPLLLLFVVAHVLRVVH